MPRTKINALYYPDMVVAEPTLKKSILLFDELHFIDRPSFTFENFGSIGCASPLRQFEASFREAGVPFYVHGVQGGRIGGELLEQVKADVDDELFLKKFKEGLESSQTFRNLHIQPGNYGEFGNENDVAQKVASVDLSSDLKTHGSASNLLLDKNINPFDLSTQIGRAKQLISMAALCSAKLSFALDEGVKNGFFPLADANPYGDLLGARYARAVNKLEPAKNKIQITDLSFAIFDELISSEHIEKLPLKKIVDYRKASEKGREEFLEYLTVLQAKQASIGLDGDYAGAIEKLVKTEIVPAVHTFRNKLKTIDESLIGKIAKGGLGFVGSNAMNLFGDIAWANLLTFGAPVYLGCATIDAYLAQRAAKRECSISYLLSLDK